jgi:hypothetical protein
VVAAFRAALAALKGRPYVDLDPALSTAAGQP